MSVQWRYYRNSPSILAKQYILFRSARKLIKQHNSFCYRIGFWPNKAPVPRINEWMNEWTNTAPGTWIQTRLSRGAVYETPSKTRRNQPGSANKCKRFKISSHVKQGKVKLNERQDFVETLFVRILGNHGQLNYIHFNRGCATKLKTSTGLSKRTK